MTTRETNTLLCIPTPSGNAYVRPREIAAIFPYEDRIDPKAKSWIKFQDNTQLKFTLDTDDISKLLEGLQ